MYWICIGVTLLGICLILISFRIQIFVAEIKSIGTTLCSIGIIGFIFQYYFQTSLENHIAEILIKLKESVMPEVAENAKELGIRRILFGRYEFDKIRLDLYDNAKNILWLSHGVNLPPQYDMVKEILDRLKKGVHFRFLTSADSSAIQEVMERLIEIKNRNKGPGQVKIRIYEGQPRWYVHIIDDKIYAQPYLYDVEISKTPMFEIDKIEKGEGFYEYFLRHCGVVWRDAKPIDQSLSEVKK